MKILPLAITELIPKPSRLHLLIHFFQLLFVWRSLQLRGVRGRILKDLDPRRPRGVRRSVLKGFGQGDDMADG